MINAFSSVKVKYALARRKKNRALGPDSILKRERVSIGKIMIDWLIKLFKKQINQKIMID